MREAREAVRFLVQEVYKDPQSGLSELQAHLARRMAQKFRLKMPYELRILFCKKCKAYSPPIFGKTIRIRKGRIIFTCLRCGKKYRLFYKDVNRSSADRPYSP
nr:Rnase P, protein component 4 [uncultured archaeon]